MGQPSSKQTIWVTGAGSGIGLALCEQLATEGHQLIISGRTAGKLNALAEKLGGDIITLPCDISDHDQMSRLFEQISDRVSHLDTAYLCAGTCEYIDYPDLNFDCIKRVCDTNYLGTVNSCIAALPLLEKAATQGRKPHLLGIGSMSSFIGFPRAEAYGASKAAIAYFLDSLRIDLGKRIDVTVVYPGFVDTPLTRRNDFDMPFLIDADSAASTILRKATKRPRTISFPWQMNLALKFARIFQGYWYNKIMPRMNRNQKSAKEKNQ